MLIPTLELALCVRLQAHHTNSTKSNYNLQKSLGNKHDSKKSQIFMDGKCQIIIETSGQSDGTYF